MSDRPAYDENEERPERIEHRRKIAEACANPPFTPSTSTNNPPPSATSDQTRDSLWLFARGGR